MTEFVMNEVIAEIGNAPTTSTSSGFRWSSQPNVSSIGGSACGQRQSSGVTHVVCYTGRPTAENPHTGGTTPLDGRVETKEDETRLLEHKRSDVVRRDDEERRNHDARHLQHLRRDDTARRFPRDRRRDRRRSA
jgi:hypothetical protein